MRKMGIGLGVGINRSNYAQGIFGAYATRVVADGGVVESGTCVDAVSSLLQSASLLLIPSGYKGGKLYAEIPTNGNGDLTWTRGGDAFRTNASGLIQRVPWNLLQYSEAFDNASWIKIASTVTTNTTTAPDGNTTADIITENTATGRHFAYAQITTVSGTIYFASIYAKNLSRRYITISLKNVTGASPVYSATFDLNNGTNTTSFSGGSPSNTSNFITSVGNGWYRIGVSMQATSTSTYFEIGLSNSATPSYSEGMATYTGDGTSALYYWGAQLVEGTSAQTYLPTTDRLNFPRLSYMYGSCPSALLEPQRTNLVLQSQDFDNASWVKTNVTITANTTTSPDGSTNADKIIATTTNDLHICESSTNSFVTGTAYTFSFYAKKSENDFIQFTASSSLLSTRANFNVSNGTLGTVDAGLTASITSANDGWYRCIVTFTASATGSFRIILGAITTSTAVRFQTFAGNGTSGVFLYGAQLEAGAYPTTYIPTTSATATRVADSFSRNNIYTNGWISASGGTWFMELRGNVGYPRISAYPYLFVGSTANGSAGNVIGVGAAASGRPFLYYVQNGTFNLISTTPTDTCKIAFAWTTSVLKLYVNGSLTNTFTGLTWDVTSFQNILGIGEIPMFIQQMALFNSALTDTQCQTLTT